ncbi:Svx/AvrXca family virulence/avirulence protein [Jonesia quinghaiensis]|uniref:Svx/AvrXca family virulence/avirulence protein n=1 Tax=Jonesia quinghaiensis TaxID=262806 RepID=UPI0009FFCFD8|nr:Svx/AvrXca family virulence/avirulence protein [Jonesia quinghaiensis]
MRQRRISRLSGIALVGALFGSMLSIPAAANAATTTGITKAPVATATSATCTAGTWTTDPAVKMFPEQYTSEHFSFRWKSSDIKKADVETAAKSLEEIWGHFMTAPISFPEPHCDSSTKRRVNIEIDPSYALTGGVTGEGAMGMWIGPGALKDRWGLAHELTHALQGSTKSFRDSPYVGWIWESHANWMTHQLPEFRSNVHCSELFVNNTNLYYGSTRNNYCNWQFWEYVKINHGIDAVQGLWKNAPKPGTSGYNTADPFAVLMKNQGWSIDRLNDEFGNWAMRNITWDYGTDTYRKAYGGFDNLTGDRTMRLTPLNTVDGVAGRYSVPFEAAPQRWGYNVVRLMPDAGASSITVGFNGIVQGDSATAKLPGFENEPSNPGKAASGWRWGVVVEGADGKPRYSALNKTTNGTVNVPLKSGDKGVYLTVLGAPTELQSIKHNQPYYSIYRYPWTVDLTGAKPAELPKPAGRAHSNGGGWVANGATVAQSAYVGPRARVLGGTVSGNARIEDHATIMSGTVTDNAVVRGMSLVRGNAKISGNAVINTTFRGVGAFQSNITVSGNAQIHGDNELWPTSFESGVWYGFADDDTKKTHPMRNLTAPVSEVTRKPTAADYTAKPPVSGGEPTTPAPEPTPEPEPTNPAPTPQPTNPTDPTTPGAPVTATPVTVQSYNFPQRFIRHQHYVGRIDPLQNTDDWNWKRVAGLSTGDGTRVSFESANFPGYYLRQVGREVKVERNDGTAAFAQSATFREIPGLADASAVSFEAVSAPDRYLRHYGYVLYVDPVLTAVSRADATWRVVK